MNMTITELIGLTIGIGVSAFAIVILMYANYTLLRDNRLLRAKIMRQRTACWQNHVTKPF